MANEAAGWPGARPFVGRTALLDELHIELGRARSGAGRAVFLHGPPGSGRAALVRLFEKQARRDYRRLQSAIGDAADPDTPAWKQIAFRFTATRRVGLALRRSTADIVDLLPVVGGVLAAIVDTFNTLRPSRRKQDEPETLGTGSTLDQVRLLFVHGRDDARLIVLENLEAADPDEMAGAFALIQRLPGTRMLFVCTSTSRGARMPQPVADLLREAERLGVGRALEIPPLGPDEVIIAVREATGVPLPDAWRDWLLRAAPPTPTRLWELLGDAVWSDSLVQRGRGWEWKAAAPPAGSDALIPPGPDELDGLSDADRAMLARAGTLGAIFEVPALAAALGQDELAVEDRLARLARRKLIALHETARNDDELFDIYRFVQPADAARWALLCPLPLPLNPTPPPPDSPPSP